MYTGWIPTVSGYLSFSHIGGIRVRNRTFEEDIFPPTKFLEDAKWVSLIQARNLSDRPHIGGVNANPKRGRFVFLMQAEVRQATGEDRTLSGIVFCAPEALSTQLRRLHQSVCDGKPSELTHEAAAIVSSHSETIGNGFFAVRFDLCDDGVISITSMANALPETKEGRLCAFEAYSFVKDVLHQHRFHSPTDDALLELTSDDPQNPDLWAERATKNIHRSVISSFRSSLPSAQVDGLGKLAYLEALLQVLARRNLSLRHRVQLDTLKLALNANQSRALLEREEKSFFLSFMLSLAAIALPIIFVCLQLLQIPCIEGISYSEPNCSVKFRLSELMLRFTELTLLHLHWVMVISVVLVAVIILVMGRKRLHAYNSGKLALSSWTTDLRDMVLRLAVSSRPLTLTIIVIAGLLIFAAAVFNIRLVLRLG